MLANFRAVSKNGGFPILSEDAKGEMSWPETGIIGVDNEVELKKLCGFEKNIYN